jgi:hypothetical protein
MNDAFMTAYQGSADYDDALGLVRSLVKVNSQDYLFWRTFEWHWEKLATLIDYIPALLTNFRVRHIANRMITSPSLL